MKRTGYATILAIASVGIVSASIATLAVLFSGESRLTAFDHENTQLRQLLLAGADDVNAHAKTWETTVAAQKWSIALPTDLSQADSHLTVEVTAPANSSVVVEIAATIGKRQQHQHLEYRQVNGHWQLASAQLTP